MGKYLITGTPGVGKTAVTKQLSRRGYAAYNTDGYKEITWFDDLLTGKPLKKKPPAPFDDKRYAYNWRLPALKKLMNSADTVFASCITANTIKNLSLFDKVFVLHVSVTTLKKRLKSRTNNDFGKHPEELEGLLSRHEGSDDFWRKKGAIIIDAEQPISKVADEILSYINGS